MNKFVKKTFINREYSWLKFNERVLEEAESGSNPLLEQCKFLSIFTGNLDEFFMVRVGSLLNDFENNPKLAENKTGLLPAEQLDGVYRYAKKLYALRGKAAKNIFKRLKAEGLRFQLVRSGKIKPAKRFEKYFKKTVLPLLSPVVLGGKHPLIHLENLKMYVLLHLESGGKTHFGVLPVPHQCDRLIADPTESGVKIMTLEDLTYYYADEVFGKYKVLDKALVRLTRNADFDAETFAVDYESEYDFSKLLKGKVDTRPYMRPVRLEISGDSPEITAFLCKRLNMEKRQCFAVDYFFDYKFLFSLDKFISRRQAETLKYPPFKGRQVPLIKPDAVIDSVLARDVFLAYPFDSMDTFIDILDAAAADPRVAAIKMTIYRLDKQSRIVEALRRASRNGKDVTVIVELAARFDEENNLHFASV